MGSLNARVLLYTHVFELMYGFGKRTGFLHPQRLASPNASVSACRTTNQGYILETSEFYQFFDSRYKCEGRVGQIYSFTSINDRVDRNEALIGFVSKIKKVDRILAPT
jgi:hypothetical protein